MLKDDILKYLSEKTENYIQNQHNDITSEEILEKYPIEAMENMIMRRPCKFLS